MRKINMFLMAVVVFVSFGFGMVLRGVGDSDNVKVDFREIRIEGCLYIYVDDTNVVGKRIYSITHKGNCPNEIHRCQ